jgi:hypothetical protein
MNPEPKVERIAPVRFAIEMASCMLVKPESPTVPFSGGVWEADSHDIVFMGWRFPSGYAR